MKKTLELLAPGGDVDSIKAAILAGADAIYCGLDKFNARNRATNLLFDDLFGILRLAHHHNCKVFLTLNILIVDSEIPALFGLLNKLVNTKIDGIIVQDLGLFYLLSRYFKSLDIHASTQLTTHNAGQIRFLGELKASRVNLSRELNLQEIKNLTDIAHQQKMLTEVFVHGSNCLSFSGLCYLSSVQSGNSGNRGRCSQPCRDQFKTTAEGKNFPLNLKDNAAFSDLQALADAGVDSLKIEGRIKKFHYVYTVVDAWRKQLQDFYDGKKLSKDKSALYKVFNRDFSNAYLQGNISRDMFIDNPRDHSAIHMSERQGPATEESLEKAKGDVYDERTGIIATVESRIANLSVAKVLISLHIAGQGGSALQISVTTPETSFEVFSEENLALSGNESLSHPMLVKRFNALNESEYYIAEMNLDKLIDPAFISYKALTAIRKEIMRNLNGGRESLSPQAVPVPAKSAIPNPGARLSVLLTEASDVHLCEESTATFFFQLPDSLKAEGPSLLKLFREHNDLIPCFPAVILGEDYNAAIAFLRALKPARILTNNSGIAWEARQLGIPWIAGPYLNLANSFSLICLKEQFQCAGAFISNELSKVQIKGIKKPDDFDLHFSIYHPVVLMTSRQCLFQQVTGCEKTVMDDACLAHCERSAPISRLNDDTFIIEKSKGNHHRIYHNTNSLNTDIVQDLPDLFSSFLIDFSNIQTGSRLAADKLTLIHHFEDLLRGDPNAGQVLKQLIQPNMNIQYVQGI